MDSCFVPPGKSTPTQALGALGFGGASAQAGTFACRPISAVPAMGFTASGPGKAAGDATICRLTRQPATVRRATCLQVTHADACPSECRQVQL
ncbi:hypothetical protein AK812_SmicGene12007 [Symbiodinium microadriaticum]|uniref:Uncharacterized protein n=1 Tax=Symbiodinium microadriaticum TaxID=2951 RepID=A0A1Q9EBU5_SYMMI|nr:hypothetical protein AK812_SmicGene12007 [Symbiodinium microadriaticum]